jgi:hypothetical protein
MMVTITSWAPVFALRNPTIPPQIPARIIAKAIAARMWIPTGRSYLNPIKEAPIAPKIN